VAAGTRIQFDRASFSAVDFSGQRFASFQATGSTFESCDFSGSVIESGVLGHRPSARFIRCNFTEADLRLVAPQFARFEGCTFADTRIDGWNCICSEFVECVFRGRIIGVTFSGQPWGFCKPYVPGSRAVNEFRSNDFRQATLEECSFLGGIELSDNQFPDSPEYIVIRDLAKAIDRARARLDLLDPREVPYANGLLLAYSSGGFTLQRDLIVRKKDLGPELVLFEEDVAADS
jgi:uncharacterized protein YjbI with pentapeptide repeats